VGFRALTEVPSVLYLALILLLTFLVVMALLWGGTRLIQAALYEQPEPDLYWRAPAAAAGITAFLGVWALFNYMAAEPGQKVAVGEAPFDTLFNFTTEKESPPIHEFVVVRGKEREKYVSRDVGRPLPEYRGPENKLWTARRGTDVEAILVKEGDHDVTFKTVVKNGPNKEQYVERYVQDGGKSYLDSESFGRISTPRGGGSFVRVLLNVLHFGVWFACLWLLLRFQWPHALGLAVALWLVMTFVAPYLLMAGANAKAERPVPRQTAPV
jgi:hypothetical protein